MPGVPPARYAYLGPEGTFAEQALRTLPAAAKADLQPHTDVTTALDAVRRGEADGAMVPLENSVEGAVALTLDELAARNGADPLMVTREVLLTADEGEAVAELEQERLQPVDEGGFQVAFGGRAGEVEEVQDVGVAAELLGELGVGRGQLVGEVRRGGAGAQVQPVHDLVEQDVAGPAVLGRGSGIPLPLYLVVELVEQHGDVTPGQSANRFVTGRASGGTPHAGRRRAG